MLGVTALLVPILAAVAQDPGGDDAFDKQVAAIIPSAEDLVWRSVPWLTEFRTALIEAAKLDRPVLLWAMNGHPLGQT